MKIVPIETAHDRAIKCIARSVEALAKRALSPADGREITDHDLVMIQDAMKEIGNGRYPESEE